MSGMQSEKESDLQSDIYLNQFNVFKNSMLESIKACTVLVEAVASDTVEILELLREDYTMSTSEKMT